MAVITIAGADTKTANISEEEGICSHGTVRIQWRRPQTTTVIIIFKHSIVTVARGWNEYTITSRAVKPNTN